MTNLKADCGVSGEFKITVTRNGVTRIDTEWQPNLYLNQGLDHALGGVAPASAAGTVLAVGTGTSTPVSTQVSLDARIATVGGYSATLTNSGAPDYIHYATTQYVFAQGAVVGNISELGLAYDSGVNSHVTRARILDGVGNPTSLSVTAIDQLTVQYRVGLKYSLSDVTGTVVIGGVSYGYVMRVSNIGTTGVGTLNQYGSFNAYQTNFSTDVQAFGGTSTLGSITSAPSGTSGGYNSTGSWSAFTLGSFQRDVTITFPVDSGNVAGGVDTFAGMLVAGTWPFQMKLNAKIPKNNTKILNLTFRVSVSAL